MALTQIDTPNLSDDAREFYFKGMWRSPLNDYVVLDIDAGFQFQVIEATVGLESGTCSLAVQINNGAGYVNVGNLGSFALTAGLQTATATTGNTVNEAGRLRIQVSSVVDPAKLVWSVRCREVVA